MVSSAKSELSSDCTNPHVLGCLDSLAQCRLLIESLGAANYGRPVGKRSGVGPHMRHCLDHYEALLSGLPLGEADYDARERDERLEQDCAFALALIDQISAALQILCLTDMDRPIAIVQIPGPDLPKVRVDSTVGRELLFLMSHTVHHLALMKMLAEQLMDVALPESLGLAYSTIAHQQSLAAAK